MNISFVGLAVSLALFLLGRRLGAPVFIGLLASLPFGATAIGMVGGSTPLIFTIFELSAVLLLLLSRVDFQILFKGWADWLVLALAFYVFVGAMILPRLFAGDIMVPGYVQGVGLVTQPLGPVTGNLTQSGYFALAAGTYFAFRYLLLSPQGYVVVRRGFFALAAIHAGLGTLDLMGKIAGATDILAPLRTAAYEIRTSEQVAGFWRISGGFPEASAFASVGVTALAFCFSYWRSTGDRGSFVLVIWLMSLLAISTSTTAYVTLAIVSLPLAGSIALSICNNNLANRDLIVLGGGVVALAGVLCVYVVSPAVLDPMITLFQDVILNKATSQSGLERSYWNAMSIEAFQQSFGIGIGIGTSRASSWLIAVLAQLGVMGALGVGALVLVLLLGLPLAKSANGATEIAKITAGVRASGLASLVAAALISGSADPGVLFFVSLAVVVSARELFTGAKFGSTIPISGHARPKMPMQGAGPA